MRKEMTSRQRDVFEFVQVFQVENGFVPTVREIAAGLGASASTVQEHLLNLERAGHLRRRGGRRRALELLLPEAMKPRQVRPLPLLGQIAAGTPMLAEENIDEYVAVPEGLSRGSKEEFLLRARGDSMIDAGILDGDILVVERAEDASNGEIVVALCGEDESADEATVKTFYRENGRIRLQPENAALEPLFPVWVQVLGRVIGQFRSLL